MKEIFIILIDLIFYLIERKKNEIENMIVDCKY